MWSVNTAPNVDVSRRAYENRELAVRVTGMLMVGTERYGWNSEAAVSGMADAVSSRRRSASVAPSLSA